MAVARPIVTNFAGGQLGRRALARVDLTYWDAGARELTNVWIDKRGGAFKRAGTLYIKPTRDQANPCRLKTMTASSDAAYVLEFTPGYVRFYRARGQVQNAGVPVELATPYGAADLAGLSFAGSIDVLYVFHGSYAPRKIARTAAGTFTIETVSFLNGPYDVQNTGDVGAATSSSASSAETGTGATSSGGSGSGSGGDPTAPTETGGGAEAPGGVG